MAVLSIVFLLCHDGQGSKRMVEEEEEFILWRPKKMTNSAPVLILVLDTKVALFS